MVLVDSYDTAVLVSGDGNLEYVVNLDGYRDVIVVVVSFCSMTNDRLSNISNSYIDLEEVKEDIQKTSY
ncbi:MAG TPA: hypothetical protein DCG18_03500 [Richelia sp.]|nr:hypothetical protein [Richelia sp.]